jgi:uncharacterized protein (DUF2141 family)
MIALVLALLASGSAAATLRIEVDGIRNDEGVVQLALFRTADGYPRRSERAARTASIAASVAGVHVTFEDLPPGSWALAVLHDENANGRLDTNLVGVPLEGIGASREATRRLGEPRFDDARFELKEDEDVALAIVLRYYL